MMIEHEAAKRFVSPLVFLIFLSLSGFAESEQSAPPDAYVDGSALPFYGTEGTWDDRFFRAEQAEGSYKRRDPRQIMAILEGRSGDALSWSEERLEADPNDLEALYVQVVAWTQLGELEKAMTAVRQALDAGLPFGRFLAGPRDLLEPLTESEAFGRYAAKIQIQIVHGPMLGAVTERSARFWLRAAGEIAFTVRVIEANNPENFRTSPLAHSTREKDFTAVAEVTGLNPDT